MLGFHSFLKCYLTDMLKQDCDRSERERFLPSSFIPGANNDAITRKNS